MYFVYILSFCVGFLSRRARSVYRSVAFVIGFVASAIGNATSVIGNAISVIGNATSVIGNATSVIGNATSVIGNATSVIGNATSVIGNATSAIGNGTSVIGNATSVIGNATSVIGNATSVIGNGNFHRNKVCFPLVFKKYFQKSWKFPRRGIVFGLYVAPKVEVPVKKSPSRAFGLFCCPVVFLRCSILRFDERMVIIPRQTALVWSLQVWRGTMDGGVK